MKEGKNRDKSEHNENMFRVFNVHYSPLSFSGHMIEKETALQDQIKALKTELGELGKRLQVLLDVETCRKQELERMTSERTEIMTFLSDLQKEKQDVGSLCQNCLAGAKGKVTNV